MKLELWYPIKPFKITQSFGANPEYYAKNIPGLKAHNGLDLQATHGQMVRAAHDGVVVNAGIPDSKEGYGVVLRTLQPFEYRGADNLIQEVYFKSIYWHLLPTIPVKSGQTVKVGDLIGFADNTGFSTGDHLHFGLKPIYPGEQEWEWYNLEDKNGYFGAINPEPYFNGYYAEDAQKVKSILNQIISLLKGFLKIK